MLTRAMLGFSMLTRAKWGLNMLTRAKWGLNRLTRGHVGLSMYLTVDFGFFSCISSYSWFPAVISACDYSKYNISGA